MTERTNIMKIYGDRIVEQMTAQDNKLIRSVARMNTSSLKAFELAVAELRQTDEAQTTTVIDKDKLASQLGIADGKHRERDIRSALQELAQNATFRMFSDEDSGRNVIIKPIEKIEWATGSENQQIEITFSQSVMPYIVNLKRNFTQYSLATIARLESRFSVVLYKMFCLYYRQYEYYRGDKADRMHFKEPVVSTEDLKRVTDTTTKYRGNFTAFERAVLEKAVKEINTKTEFDISYRKIKKGRNIVAVKFTIDTEAERKAENEKMLDGMATGFMDVRAKAQEVMAKPSFALLLGAQLVSPLAVTDFEFVAGLGGVVSLYENFLKSHRKETLTKHLDYVKAHMTSEPTDLDGYLRVAFEDYLAQLNEKNKKKATANGKKELFGDFDRRMQEQTEKEMEEQGCRTEEELMEKQLAEIDRLKQQMYGNERQNDKNDVIFSQKS